MWREHPRSRIQPVLLNEAKNLGILIGSLLFGYAILVLLPAFHLIAQYETFPATQKSLILYTPNLLAVTLVVGSVAVVYYLFSKVFRAKEDSAEYFEVRQALHTALVTLVMVIGFLKNSYLVVMLLLFPAYLWTFVRHRKGRDDRVINTLLLLGGSITFVAMALVMANLFHVGVLYWYLFLAVAYGLVSSTTAVLFLMAIAVMIRVARSVYYRKRSPRPR